jgi:hypothetical protein
MRHRDTKTQREDVERKVQAQSLSSPLCLGVSVAPPATLISTPLNVPNVPKCPNFEDSLRADTPPRTKAHHPPREMRKTNPRVILSHPPQPATTRHATPHAEQTHGPLPLLASGYSLLFTISPMQNKPTEPHSHGAINPHPLPTAYRLLPTAYRLLPHFRPSPSPHARRKSHPSIHPIDR